MESTITKTDAHAELEKLKEEAAKAISDLTDDEKQILLWVLRNWERQQIEQQVEKPAGTFSLEKERIIHKIGSLLRERPVEFLLATLHLLRERSGDTEASSSGA